MIAVDRNKIAAPRVLTQEDSLGIKETAKIITYMNNKENNKKEKNKSKKPSFKAYKNPEVIWSLNQLFYGKCAYCETRYDATQPIDVEHFRPKGAIKEDGQLLDHDGYYWLAADWNNLLPSCVDCNRQRYQESGLTGQSGLRGKANEFPLAKGSTRAKRPGEESEEDFLLLNPCNPLIDPKDHLEFLDDGVVIPREINHNGVPLKSPRGIASIKVYGLNRLALVQRRKAKLIQIQHSKYMVKKMIFEMDKKEHEKGAAKDLIFEYINILGQMCANVSEYAGMARQHILPFILEITGEEIE